jgi:hypothetical protein
LFKYLFHAVRTGSCHSPGVEGVKNRVADHH